MARYKMIPLLLVTFMCLWPGFCLARLCTPSLLPLETPTRLNPGIVKLGERLFHDTRLSVDNSISCAHCHRLAAGGADNHRFSTGINGRKGAINAPTVFNVANQIAYFWDGRAKNLETQISGPLRDRAEMAASWPLVIARLNEDPQLRAVFAKYFPQGINRESISRALSDYMRSLVAVDSPMDRWLRGDKTALNIKQLRGYRLFQSYGCIACHQGRNVGANMYATMGVMNDYFKDRGKPLNHSDLGRYNVTGRKQDRYVFKVPSLRLVAMTPPYFHDGSTQTLEKAVQVMAYYQLGRTISPHEVSDIVAFLRSLRGQHPALLGKR